MTDNIDYQYLIKNLVDLEKAGIGELAKACADAVSRISHPEAYEVSINVPGMPREIFVGGITRYRKYLSEILKNQGFTNDFEDTQSKGFITISTKTDETICIGAIRHLGNRIGYAAAIAKDQKRDSIPLDDALRLVISQVEARIHNLLAPGSRVSLEIFARNILESQAENGVSAVCVRPESPVQLIISIAKSGEDLKFCEVEEFPLENAAGVQSGSELTPEEISLLWPEVTKIGSGFWLVDSRNRILALGFSDKKPPNKTARTKIEKELNLSAEDDIDYIAKSFEKLKASYEKMVNSERAAAVTETAVTVNHEINNPLTAILGNTQLLLMNKDKLSKETVAKLETIEKSAIKIREVTDKLMTIIEPVRKHYASGLQMIDVEKSRKKSDEEK
jgi:hypothetical protein